MPTVKRSVMIRAPIERIFDLIADVERYPEFLSDAEGVKLLRRRGSRMEAHFTTRLLKRLSYTLAFTLKKPGRISWEMISGDPILTSNDGSWKLVRKGKGGTEVTFTAKVELSLWMPEGVVRALVEGNLARMLEAFKERGEDGERLSRETVS